jgi:hypothetical protein
VRLCLSVTLRQITVTPLHVALRRATTPAMSLCPPPCCPLPRRSAALRGHAALAPLRTSCAPGPILLHSAATGTVWLRFAGATLCHIATTPALETASAPCCPGVCRVALLSGYAALRHVQSVSTLRLCHVQRCCIVSPRLRAALRHLKEVCPQLLSPCDNRATVYLSRSL